MSKFVIRKSSEDGVKFGYDFYSDDPKAEPKHTKATFDDVDEALEAIGKDDDFDSTATVAVDDDEYVAEKQQPINMRTFVARDPLPSTQVAAEVTEVPAADAKGAVNDASATPGAASTKGKGAAGSQTSTSS